MIGAYIALAIFVIVFASCAWFAARDEQRDALDRLQEFMDDQREVNEHQYEINKYQLTFGQSQVKINTIFGEAFDSTLERIARLEADADKVREGAVGALAQHEARLQGLEEREGE